MINFKNLKNSQKIFFLAGGIALLVVFIFVFSKNDNELGYSSDFVQRGPLREEVSATGKVESAGRIDLSFRTTGNVSKILVENGDEVKKGQVLASLENNDLWAQLEQAQANLEAEVAHLNELKKGTREETINVKQIELSKARQDLNNYYETVINTLNDVYAKSEEAIKINTKDIFYGAEAANSYVLTFDPCVTNEIASLAGYARLMSERELKQWKDELMLVDYNISFEELLLAIQKAKNHLSVFNDYFNKLNNVLMADCSYSNPYLDVHRVNANHGRNLIIAAVTSVDAVESSMLSQNFLVEKIKNELDLLLAGSTTEQIAIQEAKVKSAQANISNIYALIEKTIIRAPKDGVIAKKNLQEGETVTANTPVISIMDREEALEVRAYIPEVDVSKIEINSDTLITLDAFPRQALKGKITEVDLAETVIDGVVYYQVKSSLEPENLAVKVGMTAELTIIVDFKEDALFIPRRAVIEREGKTLVRVPAENEEGFEEREVQTGIRSPEGNIEILRGLEEGEEIITYINTKK
jgi:HlyD family secretion protein